MSKFEWIQRFKTQFAMITSLFDINWEQAAEKCYAGFLGEWKPEQAANEWKRMADEVYDDPNLDCQV